jgi:hypothetical protein
MAMSTPRRSWAFVIGALLVLLFVGSGPSVRRADADSPGWIGSWFDPKGRSTSSALYICPGSSDPCSAASQIINLASLTKDGISINADFGTPLRSPGLGVWVKTGHNRFAVTIVELLTDAQGALAGRSKVRATLKFNPGSDTWDGPFRVDITDASGQNVLDHFEGTVHATRIHVEASALRGSPLESVSGAAWPARQP